MTPERVVIGDAELWYGRWEAIYQCFPKDAAIVSDPPYGMAWDTRTARFTGGNNSAHRRGTGRSDNRSIHGDAVPFDPSPWLAFPEVILWGSHHFAQRLPVGTTLVWVKRLDGAFGSFLSDAELAWMQGGHGVYCFRDLSMNGEALTRQHPCQKPLGLIRWCIEKTSRPLVIDPFAGSFTPAVAALQLGRKFIGCEIDRRYFDIGCRRVEEASRQLALFPPVPPPPPATQLALLKSGRHSP